MNNSNFANPAQVRKKAFDILPDLRNQLAEYISFPSISGQLGADVDRALDWLQAHMSAIGLAVKRTYHGSGAFLIARSQHRSDRPTVLLYGHADVYPVEGQNWSSDPWTLVECKDHSGQPAWQGRGTSDNKGQTLAVLAALRLLLPDLPVNVTMLIETQEETGSPDLGTCLETHRDLLVADLLLGTDGFRHLSGRPTICLGFRGDLQITLISSGVGRDLHSGNFGGVVPNPAARLVKALSLLFDSDGNCILPGFYSIEVPETVRSTLASVPNPEEYFRTRLHLKHFAGDRSFSLNERLLALPTLNISGLSSGGADSGPRNIIPGEAIAYLECRTVPDQDWRRVPEMIRRALDKAGYQEVRMEWKCCYEPSRTDPDNPWVRVVVDSLADFHQQEPCLLPNLGGSLGNNLFQDILGLPTIWFPIAQRDNNQHGSDEHLSRAALVEGVASLYWILSAIGRAGKAVA